MFSSHKTIRDWKEKASQLNIKLAENKQKQSPKNRKLFRSEHTLAVSHTNRLSIIIIVNSL